MPNKCENSSIDNKVESRDRVIIRQGITDPVAFDLQAVEHIPRDPKRRTELSALIGAKFFFEFTDRLSRRERHLWDEGGLKSSQICKRMDDFILEQADVKEKKVSLKQLIASIEAEEEADAKPKDAKKAAKKKPAKKTPAKKATAEKEAAPKKAPAKKAAPKKAVSKKTKAEK